MPNSLVIHGAIFAVGALVGGSIATAVARKKEGISPRSVTRPQQPVAPILQLGTVGDAVITPNVGTVRPPLKYGNPGISSLQLCEAHFLMSVVRSNNRPARPQSLRYWL